MGIVLPEIVDRALDLAGVDWPNVDEDDYSEMADGLREFAEKFEGHGGDAHKAITRILGSSEGWAVDAMEKHWSYVRSSHLEKIPEVARIFASVCDRIHDIVVAMKTKATVELSVLAGTIVAELAASGLTLGLSAAAAAGEIVLMRQIVKRLVKEAIEEILAEIAAKLAEPVTAKLEALAVDAALDLAEGAFHPDGGHDSSGGPKLASAGAGMTLASAGGGAGKRTHIDHVEFEYGAGKVSLHGGDLGSKTHVHLGKAKGAFGRTKGKDGFTKAFDSALEKALDAATKTVTRTAKHVSDEIPTRVKAASRHQKGTDRHTGDKADRVEVKGVDGGGKGGDGGGKIPGRTGGAPDDGRKGGDQDPRKEPLKLDSGKQEPEQKGRPVDLRKCDSDPVDVASGQMLMTQRDVELPGTLPLVLRRTHLSDYRWGHWFGANWASTLDERLEQDGHGEGAVWAREDGSLLIYPRLPQPSDTGGVLPSNGPAMAMFHAGHDNGATTYRIHDRATGVSRFFTGSWLNESPAYWLCEIEDRNHNGVTITRTGTGLPQEVVHDGGYRITVDTTDDRVTGLALQTPDGPVTLRTFGYDRLGFVNSVTTSTDATTRFTYDARGQMTAWTDSNDSTYRYEYNGAGRVIRTLGPDGYLSSAFAYEELQGGGRLTHYTDSLGGRKTYRINADYQVTAVTDQLGNTTTHVFQQPDAVTAAGRSDAAAMPATARGERDRVLSTTDPLGRTVRFGYDADGNLALVVRPDGRESTAVHNAFGLPVSVTGFDGRTWHQEYDDRGNRTGVTDPEGRTTRFSYDDKGRLTSVTDPTGAVTRVRSSEAGLTVETTDPLGAVSSCTHDAFGRVVTWTDPVGAVTRAEWDTEGRILTSVHADGSSEHWTHDGEGNCLSHTDRSGGTTRFEYTHFDLLAARTDPGGARHQFTHDTDLRLTQVTNPVGLTWTYVYDAAGRPVAETDFDDRTQTYAYDAAGQVTSRTTALGQRITFDRDLLGRTVRKDADGQVTTYAYDPSGQLGEAVSPDAVIRLERDEQGRVVSESVNGRTLHRHYDRFGRLSGRTTPSGARTAWTYDAAGRRDELTTAGRTLRFAHDAAGKETGRRIGEHLTLEHAYDEMGRRTSQTVTGTEGLVRQRDYHYRADGNLIRIEDSLSGTRTFDLDANGRVTGVSARDWTESYAYDSMGNQTYATWPEHHPGPEARGERVHEGTRVLKAGRFRYEYDAAGRTTLRQKTRLSAKPDTWRYTWDAEDRLTSVTTPDGTLWRYKYDALGRRISKQRICEDGTTVAERVDFTWDGTTLCEQTTVSAETPRPVTLTWDHDGHRPLTQTERLTGPGPGDDADPASALTAAQDEIDSRFYAIVTDLVGTPTELLDENGDTAWHTRTTLWGTTSWSTTSTTYTPLRFPGQYYDPETGLHYNYFRHYDPETSHYLSPDPLGLAPADNPSAYVTNPGEWSDPLGLTPCRTGEIDYGRIDANGRRSGTAAIVTRDMLGTGTRVPRRLKPPGFRNGDTAGDARGHLHPAALGGRGDLPENVVRTDSQTDNGPMNEFEKIVARHVALVGPVLYSSTPHYRPGEDHPHAVTLEAFDDNGWSMRNTFQQPY
ncbi:DUF6531 domain-containing protein [Streptomyces xanthii]|uniref:RHS repeat protein n=1 Tax=Streptomyces xanthii TaxID=2768069 RepID=A0A7H1B0J7_9ACTN|nr:DUF6531 domain-containing protein [Streptomyces xanthii]QNS02252.1 RHS repeat protein [Streptomyces xanthii]